HYRQVASAANNALSEGDRLFVSKLRRFAHHAEDGKSVGASLGIKIYQPIGAVEVERAAFVKRRHRDDVNAACRFVQHRNLLRDLLLRWRRAACGKKKMVA